MCGIRMNGFINFLKPPGMTSSDAVVALRKLLPRKTPVGHGGTLDPEAAGVLPLCVGKATRLFDYIIDKDKTYIGEICFGARTDTDDATGRVLERSGRIPDESELAGALTRFIGDIMQVPPGYSAIKREGEPMYKKARRGEDTGLEARKVRIERLVILARTAEDRYLLKIVCGKGVYIRALMRDLGKAAGSCAHMSFLLRSRAGSMDAENALTLDEIKALKDISDALMPMDAMLGSYPALVLGEEYRQNVRNGQSIRPEWTVRGEALPSTPLRLYVGDEFAGMGELADDGSVRIKTMLLG